MTYLELAEQILKESDAPLTVQEIWQLAVEQGLNRELNSTKETPYNSLSGQLSTACQKHDSIFSRTDERPGKYYLKDKEYTSNPNYEKRKVEEGIQTSRSTKLLEKDLHPLNPLQNPLESGGGGHCYVGISGNWRYLWERLSI